MKGHVNNELCGFASGNDSLIDFLESEVSLSDVKNNFTLEYEGSENKLVGLYHSKKKFEKFYDEKIKSIKFI